MSVIGLCNSYIELWNRMKFLSLLSIQIDQYKNDAATLYVERGSLQEEGPPHVNKNKKYVCDKSDCIHW